MKKISMFLVAGIGMVAALQLTSCKKDSGSSATLVGSWASKTMRWKESTGGKVISDTTMPYTDYELTMKADKTYNIIDVTDTANNDYGTYATSGSKLYLTAKDGQTDTMDYTLSSTQLSLINTMVADTTTTEMSVNFTKK
jgi:hypothetical protein